MRFFKKRKEEKIAVPQGVGKRGNGFRHETEVVGFICNLRED